jgi:SAM-dependent methyltransferase
LALISAATLAYEILLMRLFSIIQWHHFAYMIISLALLGYGASGTVLTLCGDWIHKHFEPFFLCNAALFSLSSMGCYLLAQAVEFNPLELLWEGYQWLRLVAIYSLLLLPFVFAANCVCVSLSRFKGNLNAIYAVDLVGAGLGAMGVIGLLYVVFPLTGLGLVSSCALLATALAWLSLRFRPRWPAVFFAGGALLQPILLSHSSIAIAPVEYKGLSQMLQVLGMRVLTERSSPLGLLTAVHSPDLPLRHVPGMSLNAVFEPPEQIGIFTDGDTMSVVTRYDGKRGKLAYLDQVPSALPYHLLDRPKVLILGAGGGADVLQALYHNAAHIDAVEIDPQMVDLVRREYAEFAGRLYDHPRVSMHLGEARGFVAANDRRFDLIQIGLLDAFSTASAGLYALNESYIYTVEAVQDYLDHLAPGGFLAITRWVRVPPRDSLKLFATFVEAMRREGVADPEQRIVWIRGWQTSTLLVKNGGFSSKEIDLIREFCRSRWFDTVYFPGIRAHHANRFNMLERPFFFEAASALLDKGDKRFIEQYKFNIAPATDDRPYFFQFFKWSVFPELMALRSTGGMSLLDLGYLVLPLSLGRLQERVNSRPTVKPWRVLVYFFAIGTAFMFIEIAFIQKFILYLVHPLYAVAVVLTGFLVFAGIGSGLANAFERFHRKRSIWPVVAAICLVSILYLLVLPFVFRYSMAAVDWIRIGISILCIAPLAFFMGMPFPLGLSRLAGSSEPLIPWAWGINGCASVVSAVMATLIAIHFGMTAVILIALFGYILAAWSAPVARRLERGVPG